MAEALILRNLSYTLVDYTKAVTMDYVDGDSEVVMFVLGVNKYTSSSTMPTKREDGTPFIDHMPTQAELYELGARSAHAAHWASSDQIPHVLISKQNIDVSETTDHERQTRTFKAELMVKQLVRVVGCSVPPAPLGVYQFMDKDGVLYLVSV